MVFESKQVFLLLDHHSVYAPLYKLHLRSSWNHIFVCLDSWTALVNLFGGE